MLRRLYEITLQLIIKDFKVRYKGTLLGYMWALVTPLVFAVIFNFIFQHIVRFEIADYPLFLVSGLFAWQWFANSVTGGAGCFLHNSSLIKKLSFPRYLIPFSVVLIDAVHFVFAIPIILVLLLAWDKPIFYYSWLWGIPLVAMIQLILIYGLTLIVASLNTLFRDIDRIATLLVTMLFYFTPVFYSLDIVPQDVVEFIRLNPLAGIISAWQGLFLRGSLEFGSLAYSMAWALAMLILGMACYTKLSIRFAEML